MNIINKRGKTADSRPQHNVGIELAKSLTYTCDVTLIHT